jgi:hypothetical protein
VTRIYSRADGKTKAEESEIPLKPRDKSGDLAGSIGVTGLQIRRTTPEYLLDWHPARA